MNKLVVFCLALPLFLAAASGVRAQGDILTVRPQSSTDNICAFNVTVSNHNTAQKNIDEIKFDIVSTNPDVTFYDFASPTHWTYTFDANSVGIDVTSDNGGIAPNVTVSNFIFSYSGGNDQFDNPVTINWTTRNSGTDISTGTFQTTCTQFQQYDKLDTCTVIPSVSGGDPCFTFTMVNRNLQGTFPTQSSSTIWNVAFQLLNVNGGTVRPSKITPAPGWIFDSATTYTAYFHTENSPIDPGSAIGGWKICLRSNPNVTKCSFVWFAGDDANALIDRDTVRNINSTAASSLVDADSLSVKAVKGCLYNVTLKNYHVSNLLPPSRIVKLTLRSKTAGITFSAAPSAPPNWTKTLTADSIVYAAKTLSDGIPSGIVSTNQFSFSVVGPTTSNFDIGWETDRSTAPVFLSSGTVTQKCTIATPATDTVTIAAGATECAFDMTVKNTHNIKPQSNIDAVTLSIPAGSGQLTPTSNTIAWNSSNTSPTEIKFQAPNAAEGLLSDNSANFSFVLTPKTPGAPIVATWSTFDEAGAKLYTGTTNISCTPIVTQCDTFMLVANINSDSCVKSFTLQNRKPIDVVSMVVSVTNGWKIDSAHAPAGWTRQLDGTHTSVTYLSTDGLHAGDSQAGFDMQFSGYFPDTLLVDKFAVVAVTTDRNNGTCTSVDSVLSCLAHIKPPDTTSSVAARSEDIGIGNFTIQPNPTRGSAEISFEVHTPGHVSVTVLDLLGHQVATLSNKLMSQGTYQIPYVMNSLPDGVYYVRMQTSYGVITRKLVLTK